MSKKNETNLRVFKLRSGEEVVAKLIGRSRGKVNISRPMRVNNSIVSDPFTGSKKKIMYLNDWLNSTSEIEVSLPTNFIAIELLPDPSLTALYEKQVQLDDIPTKAPTLSVEEDHPTYSSDKEDDRDDVPDIFPELTNEAMKDMTDSVINEYEKLAEDEKKNKDSTSQDKKKDGFSFDDFMTDAFTSMNKPMFSQPSIKFSFSIPPSILQNWIESGFVDYMKDCAQEFITNDFIEEFLEEEAEHNKAKKKKKAKKSPAKESVSKKEWKEPTSEDKIREGFGNDLKDWSPNIEDYLEAPPKIDPPTPPQSSGAD